MIFVARALSLQDDAEAFDFKRRADRRLGFRAAQVHRSPLRGLEAQHLNGVFFYVEPLGQIGQGLL